MQFNYLIGTDATVRPQSSKGPALTAYSVVYYDVVEKSLHITYRDLTDMGELAISQLELLALQEAGNRAGGFGVTLVVSDSLPALQEYTGLQLNPIEGNNHHTQGTAETSVTWVPSHKSVTTEARAINYIADKILKARGNLSYLEQYYLPQTNLYLPTVKLTYEHSKYNPNTSEQRVHTCKLLPLHRCSHTR